VGLGRSSYKLNCPFIEQFDPVCAMAEHRALLNSIEEINDVLGSSDPESMADTLLRMGLINESANQKLGLDSVIAKKKARIISNTVLLKVKAEPERRFPDFVSFLKKQKFDGVVATIAKEYGKHWAIYK